MRRPSFLFVLGLRITCLNSNFPYALAEAADFFVCVVVTLEERLSAGRHSDIQTACLLCTGCAGFFSLCKNITPYLQFNEVNWVRVTKPPPSLSLSRSHMCAHTLLGAARTNNLKRESRCCINRRRTFLLSFLVLSMYFSPFRLNGVMDEVRTCYGSLSCATFSCFSLIENDLKWKTGQKPYGFKHPRGSQ